ncbi:hypothetical protein LINPERHAP1_LOCUS16917 [Linum perenne]
MHPSEMDKNMLAGLEGMPEEDKIRMASMIDQLQIRDSFYKCFLERSIFCLVLLLEKELKQSFQKLNIEVYKCL